MADWTNITDSRVDPDAPLTSELAYAWRDNPIAIAEGAVGAPRILLPAIESISAGDAVRFVAPDEYTDNATSYDVAFSLPLIQSGSLRVKFVADGGSAACLYRIVKYRNGSSTVVYSNSTNTTVSESVNVNVNYGDKLSLEFMASSVPMVAVSITNISVCTSGGNIWPANDTGPYRFAP